MTYPWTPSETAAARRAALETYEIWKTPPEPTFNRIVAMVGEVFKVPKAHINFLNDSEQWSKACLGKDDQSIGLEHAFCAEAIKQDDVFVARDTLKDPRFKSNPQVVGEPHIRFYASAPLTSPARVNVGTLCVLDLKPHPAFSSQDAALLKNFAAIVMDALELRYSRKLLSQAEKELTLSTSKLDFDARHDAFTRLPNRRYFLELLEQALLADPLFSLLLIDLDGFKRVNAAYGHAVGDEILMTIAQRLAHNTKEGDVLARLEGDAFAILLKNTNEVDAKAVAVRLERICAAPIKLREHLMSISVAAEVSTASGDADSAENLLQQAALKMGTRKAKG